MVLFILKWKNPNHLGRFLYFKKRESLLWCATGFCFGSSLLFLIYINDIYKASNKLEFYLFADDTNLLYADRNLKSLESVLDVELRNVCDWLSANKLFLNTRIAERRFLTRLKRGYIFLRGGSSYTLSGYQNPCRRPLHATESHVRLKHKLIQNIVPFWKTFVTKKKRVPFLSGGCITTFKFHHYE